MKKLLFTCLLAPLVLACSNEKQENETAIAKDNVVVAEQKSVVNEVKEATVPKAKKGFTTIDVNLKSVSESGIYGLYMVTIEGDDGFFDYYNYVDLIRERKYKNKKATITYKEVEKYREAALLIDGNYIYENASAKDLNINPEWKKITGTFNIIEESGDTPGVYAITADGVEVRVESFIDEAHEAVVGKTLTLYYYPTISRVITKIELLEEKERIAFIREKFGVITTGISSETYQVITIKEEDEGGMMEYQRAMDKDKIRFISVSYCGEHGCDKTSYYFWDDQVIFRFKEHSEWVGNTDTVSEERTYYQDEKEMRCLERSTEGTAGYAAAKKQLSGVKQTPVDCSSQFDRSEISKLLDLTKETARKVLL